MTKRFTSLPVAKGCRRWAAALVAVVAAGPVPATFAQSTLRFVDSAPSVQESSIVVMPSTAKSAESTNTELRFVVESHPAPVTSPTQPAPPSTSTVTLKPDVPAKTAPVYVAASELRFTAVPQPKLPPASELTIKVTPTNVPIGTELFGNSNPLPSSQPRTEQAFGHVPATAPLTIAATPVRTAPAITPIPAPAGTELFTSVPERKWDVPALDYGTALKQAKPQPVESKPTHQMVATNRVPTAITIKPAPMPAATELFTSKPPTQPQQIKPQAVPALAPTPAAVSSTEAQVVAAPKSVPSSTVAPRMIQQFTQSPVVALKAAAPVKTQSDAAAPIVAKPADSPKAGTELFATLPQQKPAQVSTPIASELDFSRVPVATPAMATPAVEQRVATQTAPSPVRVATATPVQQPIQVPVQQLTPVVATPATSAVVNTPTHQVVVSEEPNEPNVYKFRFAATMDEAHTSPVQNVGPEAVGPATSEPDSLPGDLTSAPCGCNNGANGIYGCPYLPGQSGTRSLCGVDCGRYGAPCCSTWSDAHCIPWSLFGPGEYVGPARPAHVDTYYLRVNDLLTLTFIESRKKSAEHYRIGVGDRLQIEWLQGAGNTELPLNRELLVQPDGTVTLPLIGEVNASGKTINDFRDEVVKLYSKYQRDPQITVTPISVNVAVQDVLKAVTAKSQSSGQMQDLRVAPDGTIQAAGIGNVYVQGLTLDELRSELEARYNEAFGPGLAVSPQLTDRAVSYVFMGGEVKVPGRYTLEGPTTVMQAIAMAGGWNIGGNVRQVVVFRRDENWCLKATKIDVRAPLYGNDPCPVNDVWLRENDLVLVPKTKILCATDMINLYFTRGVYAVFPINYVYDFSQNSGIVPIP